MYLDNERRPTLTPKLAFRVAVLGGVALVMFAVIFFRLWYLQVLSGDNYVAAAKENRVRSIKVQAPRGEIVDRHGVPLVENRYSFSIKLTPDKLPARRADREEVYRRLGRLLDLRPKRLERRVESELELLPYSKPTVKQDVGRNYVAYILERQEEFPGVEPESESLREYPHGVVGAHLFGTVGEVSPEELKDPRFNGVSMGDRVGKQGLEAEYDRYLRGRNGAARVEVDALGRLTNTLDRKRPIQGQQLRLSLDLNVQRVAQQALAGGTGRGAFAVMNVQNGEVVALGSQPSFDPNIFSKPISQKKLDALSSEELGKPLFDRAIQGGYPTGSTFKLITATAALESGLITPSTPLNDPGFIEVGGIKFRNAGDVVHGVLSLVPALTVSSDVFFYQLGRDMNEKGMPLQLWARRLGIGRKTGIDLPAESPGLLPTPKWRDALYEHKPPLTDRPWSVGDNINLSVGQGDLQANPLQMAVAYAAIANGGRVLRPRLGMRIEDATGRALQQLDAPTARRVKISPEARTAIMEGLRGAASAPGGTSTPVFEGFPIPIAGKTGTAEHNGRPDQSWYVALAPYPNPRYVVAVTDEAGGFGADTAAPMARRILAALFDVKESGLVEGGGAPD
ncbi:MAG TPA: penicillin-binding protein 2 [Thermoleophilaceae bacterium]|nr:penicillin-binding protein 2 [Thermoleophilaceae bacterium]